MHIDFKLFRISIASLILIVLIVALVCAFLRQEVKTATTQSELQASRVELKGAQEKAGYLRGVERDLQDVRQDAATKFMQYEERMQDVKDAWLQQLIEALKYKEPAVRMWAAQKLSEFGVNALDAVSALRELEQDSDPNVRAAAANAIKKIEDHGTVHDGP
jgi:HEAT repeat protein